MLKNIAIADEFTNEIEDELREFFESLTTQSKFSDRIWYFDKLHRSAGHGAADYTIYFANIPEKYLGLVRYWPLIRLRNGRSVGDVKNKVSGIKTFFSFLEKECGSPELSEIHILTIEAYEDYLLHYSRVENSTKEYHWTALSGFFGDMQTWPEMPEESLLYDGNPFSRTELDRKHSSRLVPDMVLEQLDAAYRDERLPLEDRLGYWIIRSIPSRVGEVCSTLLDCLRPYSFNNRKGFVLTIPDFKQAGNQHRPKKKLIHILDEGHGKFLLDLVREQQKLSEGAQELLPESSNGYLMVSPRHRYVENMLAGGVAADRRNNYGAVTVMNGHSVRKRMKAVADYFNITGPDGKPYDVITHYFRHNGITERLYEGFNYVEIRDMSGHVGNQMLTTAYVHVKDEEIKARAAKHREKGEQGPPVIFQGRIINMTPEKEEKLLKNPRAYRVGKLGICSDVTSCGSDLFECLDCDYLVPDADNEEFYVAEYEKWTARVARHTESGNTILAEHASNMANLHENQLDRIRVGIHMHLEESRGN